MTHIVVAFVCAMAIAACWVWYDRSLHFFRHAEAAFADFALVLLSGTLVMAYVQQPQALLAASVGAGISTYIASRWLRGDR